MRLIPKSQITSELAGPETIDDTTTAALSHCYVTHDASLLQINLVQSLLEDARASNQWVECDCKEPLGAFLFPRKLSHGGYTLVRPPYTSDYAHTKACPFHHADFTVKLKATHPSLNILKESAQQSDIDSKLLDLLVWLLGLNNLFTYPLQHFNHIQYLIKTSEHLERLQSSQTPSPYRLIWTNGKHVVPFYKILAKQTFPREMTPQGFVFCLITELQDDAVVLAGGLTIRIKNPIVTKGEGPFWGLLLIAASNQNYFEAQTGVVIPAYSLKQPIALATTQERDIVKQLISVAISSKEKRNDISVEKSISQSRPSQGFIVSSPSETLYISTDTAPETQSIDYSEFSNDRLFRQHLYARLN